MKVLLTTMLLLLFPNLLYADTCEETDAEYENCIQDSRRDWEKCMGNFTSNVEESECTDSCDSTDLINCMLYNDCEPNLECYGNCLADTLMESSINSFFAGFCAGERFMNELMCYWDHCDSG